MTFGLIAIGIYVAMIAIYVLVVTVILHRMHKQLSERKEDNNANN